MTKCILEFCLTVWDALVSPFAQDLYAGCAAIIGLLIIAEMTLAMFGGCR